MFGVGSPIAKLLLKDIAPIALAGLLYLGAFLGLFVYSLFFSPGNAAVAEAERLRKKDLPWLAGAVLAGGVVAPISLMLGLDLISGFSVSLLLNLEGVATAIIAEAKHVTYDMNPDRNDPTAVGTQEMAEAIVARM